LDDLRIGAGGFLLLDPKNITIGAAGDATPASGNYEYADNPGDSVTILATGLASQLSTGTAVTLQASNDIALATGNPITVNNASGNGGHLTLQAGRSITLNAD